MDVSTTHTDSAAEAGESLRLEGGRKQIAWRSTDDVVAKHIQNQTPMPGSAAAFAQGLGHGYMSKCASSSPIPIGRHVASDMDARIGTPPKDDVAGAIGTDIGNILPEAIAAVATAGESEVASVAGREVPQIGGLYRSVGTAASEAGLAGEVHHMPAWSATRDAAVGGATRANTPSIWMTSVDHAATASYGNRAGAIAYRAEQQALIGQGRYLDAMRMDVNNIRQLFGGKYEGAIQQMGEAFWAAHQ